jgi:prepilin-type N-terminal cleavage/methylation domain-containing protein/prepilin-type processing-associated H-X9-DG protein
MKNIQTAPRRARGFAFTLVELLVVIAIIAVLGALTFPAIKRSIENGRKADSPVKMRSLSCALQLYSNDNGNKYPDIFWNIDPSPPGTFRDASWDVTLYPYLDNLTEAMHVKRDNKIPRTSGKPRSFSIHPSVVNYMGWLPALIYDAGLPYNIGLNRLTVQSPARFCLFFENFNSGNVIGHYDASTSGAPVGDSPNPDNNIQNTGFYMLFADGHVEWHGPQATDWPSTIEFTKKYGNPFR